MVLTVSSTVPNSVTDVLLDSTSVTATDYEVDGLQVTLKHAYLSGLALAVHTFTIELDQGDPVTVAVTVVDNT